MQMTNKQMVLEAAIDLHNQRQVVSRITLEAVLNLKRISITESLSILEEEGLLDRVVSGVYVPVAQHPESRLITKTKLDDGTVNLSISEKRGDIVILLTPREAMRIGEHFMFEALQMSNIQAGHLATAAIGEAKREMKALRRQVRELQEALASNVHA
ncbi:hypothetical protein [Psychrobacter aquimaris]|uniref:hypothetical protein n=1 Tax=Psychrobacter aquimaris TaxID=292733 RepID=UPI003FD27FB1